MEAPLNFYKSKECKECQFRNLINTTYKVFFESEDTKIYLESLDIIDIKILKLTSIHYHYKKFLN